MTRRLGQAMRDSPVSVSANGWAVRSTDGSHAAHVEHTIAITDDGPLILTAPA